LVFACPRCRATLATPEGEPDALVCPADGLTFRRVGGIWRCLLPEREEHYAQFISDYEKIRAAEGRGGSSPEFYRALPYRDLSGRFSADWAIRARSFRGLTWDVLAPLERFLERPLTALDLGAGNGWLSARLAKRHARALAVDLLTNPADGLGAWTNYKHGFTPIQAEFTRLPLGDAQADVAIFNASFHYAESYEDVLTEALRALLPWGRIVVMDSPVYEEQASGEAMVREREAAFTARYGFPSNALASENFLTYERMAELGEALGLHWDLVVPNYGLRWRLRRWRRNRAMGRPANGAAGPREAAEFGLWIGARIMRQPRHNN
jgi:SAM-dependent methyltransferase